MSEPLRLPHTAGYENEDAKILLRKAIREHRSQRSSSDLEALSAQFTERAIEAVGSARKVALYVSTGGEPPTHLLLETLYARGVDILLPVLGPGLSRRWARYQGAADLSVRAPGRPPEPSGESWDTSAIRGVDVVITPGLAVDGFGTRLGQGGGWYDRVLVEVDGSTPVFTMLFDQELISSQRLPCDEFDKTIDAVITPTRVFLIQGSPFQNETLRAVS